MKQVLASLRKQRKAIDEAISALEKVPTRSTRKRSETRPSRRAVASGKSIKKDSDLTDNLNVIEFPGSHVA